LLRRSGSANAAISLDASQYKDYMLFMLHKARQRISEDRWRKALDWTPEKVFVSQGFALP